jgi:hypothetical protein
MGTQRHFMCRDIIKVVRSGVVNRLGLNRLLLRQMRTKCVVRSVWPAHPDS